MIRFHFIGFLVIFMVIPQNTHSSFLQSVLSILDGTGNLACQSDFTGTWNDYYLCAIRVYTYFVSNDTLRTVIIQDGIWFINTFRQLIETRNCTGFDDTSDLGSGICNLLPYELADTMTLCICAKSGCNIDLETCQKSIDPNQKISALPTIISDPTSIIQCANTSETNFTCSPSLEYISLIDPSACQDYVQAHSVLCTIIVNSLGSTTQQALIEENYLNYLINSLHDLNLLRQQIIIDVLNQISTNMYIKYLLNFVTNELCACMQSSFCNYNISTCASNIISTATTTTSTIQSTAATSATDVTRSSVGNSVSNATGLSGGAIAGIVVGVVVVAVIILSIIAFQCFHPGKTPWLSDRAASYRL